MLENLVEVLSYSLPFRDHYFPNFYTVLVYLIPILFGGFVYKMSEKEKLENILISSTIISTIFIILGFIQKEIFLSLVLFYYFFLFILIAYTTGFLIYLVSKSKIKIETKKEDLPEIKIETKKGFFIATIILIILFSSINLIYVKLSDYPIGADVYFNAAISMNSFGEYNDAHPYFKESNIFPYRPEAYSIFKLVNITLGSNLNDVWRFFPSIGIFIFLISLFAVIRKNFGDKVGFYSILFIGPLNQFMFNDSSPRLIAYILFVVIIGLIFNYKRRLDLVPILALSFALFFYHLEIFVQLILVLIFYFLLQKIKVSKEAYYINKTKLSKICLIVALLAILIITKLMKFNQSGSLMVYNEIVFSIIYPVGIISFVVGIFFITSITQKEFLTKKDKIILSIILLSLNSVLYFSYLWGFHHRYFTETAYIGMSIFAAQYLSTSTSSMNKKLKLFFVISIILITMLSIIPRLDYSISYSKNINGVLNNKQEVLNELSKISNESDGQVILANPQDYINRYIPFYTNFFVFTGLTNENISILTFCGNFGLMNETCRERERLGYEFFESPTKETIQKIREKYDIDYIISLKEYNTTIIDNATFEMVYENEKYVIYKIENEN
nr:hypothetical protein [Nanoarchaeum sp.]